MCERIQAESVFLDDDVQVEVDYMGDIQEFDDFPARQRNLRTNPRV